ncbi:MAG: glutamate-5-semialdehyde dehydrogenase [Proteobacteria bacterium]|nr:glutamate-5-semialdehyde dehydrogenase [Pseudomonadota bacterium]
MSVSHSELVADLALRASAAADRIAEIDSDRKNAALRGAAERLERATDELLEANGFDLEAARVRGLVGRPLERLTLTPERVRAMALGLRDVAALPDPVGEVTGMWTRPSGLQVGRMRIPLGVILVIYESRPNVTADVGGLCLKSGNAVLLRGGSESLNSNRAIAELLRGTLEESGLPADALQLVPLPDREIVDLLLEREDEIDLVVPRGGESLIRRVARQSRIPVIKHYKGVCHVYIDEFAEPGMARDIALNSKCQRVSVCNSAETLLIHSAVASGIGAEVLAELDGAGVELRGCERTRELFPKAVPASDSDWAEEFLDKTLAVRVVDSLDEAIEHIREHGSDHTETIVTQDITRGREFVRRVNSSSVLVNASTRFADGFEFGLGAEIGISTSKIHWFGPMGLEGLTSQKFIAFGEGTLKE